MSILAALGPIMGIVGKFIQDKDKLAEIEADLMKAQIQVNAAEASNEKLFVAGWRPFIGWVCGAAFAYHFIILPIIELIMRLNNVNIPLPQFDMLTLMNVLGGMLGLGGLRTYEKVVDSKLRRPQYGPGSPNYQGK